MIQGFLSPSSLLSWCWPRRHAGLLRQLVLRQVQARYRGTLFGVAWSLITPLLMMTVYTLVFRFVFKLRWEGGVDSGFDFALRLFAGLTVFGFFAETLLRSPALVLEQPNLVKKVVFPLEILPWVNCLSALVFALPGVLLLLLAAVATGVAPAFSWLSLPLIWLPLLPLLLGLGWIFAALGVYVRDVGQVLGLTVTLLGLASSIGYLYLGQRMLGRHKESRLFPALILAVVFPSGLILANTRATIEAFFSTRMDFHRTLRAGEIYAGRWRGVPELIVGLILPVFAFAEQPIGAPFFFFAVAGLVSIGAMGAASGMGEPVRQRITPGE